MKIAIIGSGIAGLASAYFLSQKHEVWLFEQADYLGGHAHTVDITDAHGTHKIDTGFIVCNKRTYPNFIRLLDSLGVGLEKSKMGFSVRDPLTNIEFAGQNLNTLFAQRGNLLNVRFWQMLLDIYRFNKYAKRSLSDMTSLSLGEFLLKHGISAYAKKYYILPIISAIWSSSISQAEHFPTALLFKFLDTHGLLDVNSAPQWYTICGGSISYVKRIKSTISGKILLNSRVENITRLADKVVVKTSELEEVFDKVVIATHSDQVLDILSEPTALEHEIFGKLKYQNNHITLHTDISILPRHRRAWASWNYFINDAQCSNITYNMNILQNLKSDVTYCVSLNLDQHIKPEYIIAKYKYAHPVYDQDTMQATSLWSKINTQNIFYAGAYWGYGFHEDGINSAIRVVNTIDRDILCNTQYTQVL